MLSKLQASSRRVSKSKSNTPSNYPRFRSFSSNNATGKPTTDRKEPPKEDEEYEIVTPEIAYAESQGFELEDEDAQKNDEKYEEEIKKITQQHQAKLSTGN